MSNKHRILVIGLDGATFDVLLPLAREGLLPNISKFMTEGARGELKSVLPPITGPAWASFMTGKNPGKHGVFEFLKKAPDNTEYPISSSEVDGKALWEILSEAGRDVVVINVPVTYPPRKVKGVLLGDFLTPKGRRDFGYPDGIVEELEGLFGPYRLYISEVYSPDRVDKVLDELFEVLDYRVKTASYLMNTRPWDFFMVHIWGTDRIQHELWHIIDTTHPNHDKEVASRNRDRVLDYYRKVDEAVGTLAELAGRDASVMVISDHGFGPIEKFLSFNVWLLDEGILRLKRAPLSILKYALFKLGITPELGYKLSMRFGFAKLRLSKGVGGRVGLFRRVNSLFLSLADVDWSKSRAYSKGNYGQIFINLKGREPHGIVEPGEEYERVVSDITSRLGKITDPDTGKRIIGSIYKTVDMYKGPHVKDAPDIAFLPYDMRYKALGTVDFTTHRFIEPVYGNYGDHRVEGILIAAGPPFKKGAIVRSAELIDIAPTVLYAMGEKIPDDMDGKVLTEALDEVFAAGHAVEYAHASGAAGMEDAGYEEGEKEEIMKRLKDLGYV
jgi:predicted AlkP superfamily phosphohydrolase/phosphomutase